MKETNTVNNAFKGEGTTYNNIELDLHRGKSKWDKIWSYVVSQEGFCSDALTLLSNCFRNKQLKVVIYNVNNFAYLFQKWTESERDEFIRGPSRTLPRPKVGRVDCKNRLGVTFPWNNGRTTNTRTFYFEDFRSVGERKIYRNRGI